MINKIFIIFFFTFVGIFLLSVNSVNAAEPKLNSIILDAKVLNFSQLTEKEKELIPEYCCSYGDTRREQTPFEVENAYFVKASINRKPLAFWSLLYDCTGSKLPVYKKKCSEKDHAKKMKTALEDNKPYILYGKYATNWEFYSGKKRIPAAGSGGGGLSYYVLTSKRDKKKQIDYFLIGPIPAKPTAMQMSLGYNTDTEKIIYSSQFKVK